MTISALGNDNPSQLPQFTPGNMPTASPPAAPASPQPPTQAQLQKAVDALSRAANAVSAGSLQFSLDSSSGKIVVQVMDTQTHQVIQQIPAASMLAIAQSLEKIQGLLLKQQA